MAKKRAKVRKARPLVGGCVERISVPAFEKYHGETTDLVQMQHGVYGLYKNDRLYYIGLAVSLGRRIKQHFRDKHAGRRSRFSLYLVRKIDHIKEIESVLLRVTDPTGIRMRGSWPTLGVPHSCGRRAGQPQPADWPPRIHPPRGVSARKDPDAGGS